MEICVFGLNYHETPLETRERLSISRSKLSDFLKKIEEKRVFDERLVLSTCNRTEIYGVATNFEESSLTHLLGDYCKVDPTEFEDKVYVKKQPDSVKHLFSVAAGLDSMVIGETEILGQVKEAYLAAHEAKQTGKVLNALFQRSLKVGKNVRTQTQIGEGRVSVASVAVDLAKKIFGTLEKTTALVIGTGEMSTQIVKSMVSSGATPLIASSRHHERAEMLVRQLGGRAVSYDRYEEWIKEIDILITATEAPRVLIDAERVHKWLALRHQKPLFLIDIAVPRNINAAAANVPNAYLYNIDDLQLIAQKNLESRKNQLEACSQLVDQEAGHYMNWLAKEFA